MSNGTNKTINIDLLINSKELLTELGKINKAFSSLGIEITNKMKSANMSFTEAAASIREAKKQQGDFNNAMGQFDSSKMADFDKEVKEVETALKGAGRGAREAESSVSRLGKTARYVFGTVFGLSVIRSLRQFVRWATEAARSVIEFERTVYLFEVSIRALQRSGLETTMEEWRDVIAQLKEQFPIFTEQEIVSAVSGATLKLREFEFTIEEINELIQLSAVLARATGKDFGEMANQITGALSRGYFEALQNIGIPIGRLTVMQEAYNQRLGENFTMLSESQRAHLGYQIVMEHSAAITEDLAEITEMSFDRIRIAEAEITDTTREMGEVWADALVVMKEAWADFLGFLFAPIVTTINLGFIDNFFAAFNEKIADGFDNLADALEKAGIWDETRDTFREVATDAREFADELREQAAGLEDIELLWSPGFEAVSFWQQVNKLVDEYIARMEDASGKVAEYSKALEETTDPAARHAYIKALNEELEVIKELIKEVEELTGEKIDFSLEIDEDTTRKDIDDAMWDVQRQIGRRLEEGLKKVDLAPPIQARIDSGDFDDAFREIERIVGRGMDDITDVVQSKSEEVFEALTNAVRDAAEEIEEILEAVGKKTSKLMRDYDADVAKIGRNLTSRLEKIERQLAQGIEDANRDAAERRAEIERDYRKTEIQEEEEFQREMKRLREDFLFDLEDALRERDALQVIRLTRQFNKDRSRAIEDRKAEKEDRAKDYQDDLADNERQQARRIEELKRNAEEQRREAQIQADRQKEERDIRYAEQLIELDAFLLDKLKTLAEGLDDEYKIDEAFLKGMDTLFRSKYAPGSAMHNYAMELLRLLELVNQVAAVPPIPPIVHQTGGGTTPPPGSTSGGGGSPGPGFVLDLQPDGTWKWIKDKNYGKQPGFAKGGALIANKPTTALFGEAGPELVTFTPLSKMDRGDVGGLSDLGSLPATITHSGDISRKDSLGVEIWLEEGLQGRIVDDALDQAAGVFDTVLRKR